MIDHFNLARSPVSCMNDESPETGDWFSKNVVLEANGNSQSVLLSLPTVFHIHKSFFSIGYHERAKLPHWIPQLPIFAHRHQLIQFQVWHWKREFDTSINMAPITYQLDTYISNNSQITARSVSGRALAGIILGSVFGIGLLAFILAFSCRRRQREVVS